MKFNRIFGLSIHFCNSLVKLSILFGSITIPCLLFSIKSSHPELGVEIIGVLHDNACKFTIARPSSNDGKTKISD